LTVILTEPLLTERDRIQHKQMC